MGLVNPHNLTYHSKVVHLLLLLHLHKDNIEDLLQHTVKIKATNKDPKDIPNREEVKDKILWSSGIEIMEEILQVAWCLELDLDY